MELRGGKNIYKLLDSINVLCQLIQVSHISIVYEYWFSLTWMGYYDICMIN